MASKVTSCRKIDAEDADTGTTDDSCDKLRPSMKRAVSWAEPVPDSPAFSAIKPNDDSLSPHPTHPIMEIGESFAFGPPRYDLQSAAIETAHSGLARKLKGRHLQMIAIGGSVGTGLFVASGKALSIGGPASLLCAVVIIGIMLFCTCQAMGELGVVFPIAGSFSSWVTRFLDPSWGFAIGWNYAIQWLIVLPLELIAASMTLSYWNQTLPRAIFVAIFLVFILSINLSGIKGYGEAEFVFSIIKIIAILGFILLGIVMNCGGPPDGGYVGFRYWKDPGAVNHGFKGLCSVFVKISFAFGGTELVGLAAAETADPRKSLPASLKQVFWRIAIFYFVSLGLIGLLIPYNDPRLLNDESTTEDESSSPFVIAIEAVGIDVLPSVMNAAILVAILSVGNSAVYGSTRSLAALANLNHAPKFLAKIDRKGRPLIALAVASAFGLLAFLADASQQAAIFDWLLAISSLSTTTTWLSICFCHIRFRKAWGANGRSLEQLPFRSQVGINGSYLGVALGTCLLVVQFWVCASPIGARDMSSLDIAKNFFLTWIGGLTLLIFFGLHKLYYRTSLVRIGDMDIHTGRRRYNVSVLVAQEQDLRQGWPRWKKAYRYLC